RDEIEPAKKGSVVTQEEYDATLKQKMEEMRQRWSGGRGRGRGR
ncbi:GLPGLI family protein, partial [Nonlabens mediterrranea]|nr:GLPGLI family protein [Nonlabens mediterrranea]